MQQTSTQLKKLNSSRELIEACYGEPLSLEELAKSSNMSAYHYLRTFKKVYGQTPFELLIKLRIERAKQLLITGNWSVRQVCEHVGYESLGSFSSLFYKHVGMPPTSYRKTLWALSAEPYRFPLKNIPTCYAKRFANKPFR